MVSDNYKRRRRIGRVREEARAAAMQGDFLLQLLRSTVPGFVYISLADALDHYRGLNDFKFSIYNSRKQHATSSRLNVESSHIKVLAPTEARTAWSSNLEVVCTRTASKMK